MNPSPAKAILGGFIGTLAITFVMYFVAPLLIGMPMDIAEMLGSLLGSNNWAAGMALHFINGSIIFPLMYAYVLYAYLPGSPAIKGITWGVVLWVLAQIAVMPMMGAGFFSAAAGGMMAAVGSLAGHMIYGWLLGAIAGPARVVVHG